jgi:anti-sigma regulatory factor (Ser/Thr protein kinase)
MDIKELILGSLKKKSGIKVADIAKATGFSRVYINRFFAELRNEGKIVALGKTNRAEYVLASKENIEKAKEKILHFRHTLKNTGISEDTVFDEIKKNTGIFFGLSKNVLGILKYAFTEMLNNAIEHSRSKTILVEMKRSGGTIAFRITDRGVGIFNNIMRERGLRDKLEAIQDLLKGKQTTAPEAHSGEGIFFTSKVGDKLVIKSFGKSLIFDNIADDVFVKDVKSAEGTDVFFEIAVGSIKELQGVFNNYSNEAFEFSTTKVAVDLYKMDTDYISRSQARRILSGLEKFKTIVLDFKNVETVGQAFADEVFRVWRAHNRNKVVEYKNANENIEFMIKRALATER